jgi:MYXO-CTERM domain-containing protein
VLDAGADSGFEVDSGISALVASGGGCSCETAGSGAGPFSLTWVGVAGLVIAVGARRRRR